MAACRKTNYIALINKGLGAVDFARDAGKLIFNLLKGILETIS